MARRMVGDDQEVYRVIIVKKVQKRNPDYLQGNLDTPFWIYLDETYEKSYGPYNTLGVARAQLTRHCLDYYKNPLPDLVGGRVEKATTTWEVVT